MHSNEFVKLTKKDICPRQIPYQVLYVVFRHKYLPLKGVYQKINIVSIIRKNLILIASLDGVFYWSLKCFWNKGNIC
jgi:hypothetical protein